MAVAETPIHTDFMDADMRLVWDGLGPMPGDLRLYGGTALALYRNHRASTDFDFVTPIPGIVDLLVGHGLRHRRRHRLHANRCST